MRLQSLKFVFLREKIVKKKIVTVVGDFLPCFRPFRGVLLCIALGRAEGKASVNLELLLKKSRKLHLP